MCIQSFFCGSLKLEALGQFLSLVGLELRLWRLMELMVADEEQERAKWASRGVVHSCCCKRWNWGMPLCSADAKIAKRQCMTYSTKQKWILVIIYLERLNNGFFQKSDIDEEYCGTNSAFVSYLKRLQEVSIGWAVVAVSLPQVLGHLFSSWSCRDNQGREKQSGESSSGGRGRKERTGYLERNLLKDNLQFLWSGHLESKSSLISVLTVSRYVPSCQDPTVNPRGHTLPGCLGNLGRGQHVPHSSLCWGKRQARRQQRLFGCCQRGQPAHGLHPPQHAYFVELFCDYYFFQPENNEIDTRELEVASSEGSSLKFKCRNRSSASARITLQFIQFAMLVISQSFRLSTQEDVNVYVRKFRKWLSWENPWNIRSSELHEDDLCLYTFRQL